MKKVSYCLTLFVFFTIGCSRPVPKQHGLLYFNDCEDIKGWQPVQFMRWPVHSGFFSNKLDSLHPYGITFKLPFREITPKPLVKVKVSLWVYFRDKTKATLVMEIKNKYEQSLAWIGIKMEDQVKEIDKWQKITAEQSLTNKAITKPDDVLSIYPWDNGKGDIYVDDISIEFIDE